MTVGQFFSPFFVFLGIFMFFQRFNNIGGWTLYEVALCYSVSNIGFALSQCFARGFDSFSTIIVNGDFDRLLLRPRTTLLQVLGSKFEFSKIGRFIQSLIVLLFSVNHLTVVWNSYKVMTLVFMIISSVFIFMGIFIFGATLCFWTIEGIEAINIFTDGGREITQYPLNIYQKWIKNFFTYIIPFATANYLPLMFILDKTNNSNIIYMYIPLFGLFFLIPCILIWNFGVKHYKSTGS